MFLGAAAISESALSEGPLTPARTRQVVETACQKIEAIYPFAEVGETVGAGILEELRSGAYDDATSGLELAERVTVDMEKLGHDKHLDLLYDPVLASELLERIERGEDASAGPSPSVVESARWEHYGFEALRSLDGGVGYLDLRTFYPSRYAGTTAAAAMGFLATSNAIIIDLRYNGGGWDDMVTMLAAYFTQLEEPEVVAISQSTLDRSYVVSQVPSYVPGRTLEEIPLYILLSHRTASAAEAFASIVKQLNDQVVLVGETTAGAENPVDFIPLDQEFVLKIPCYRKLFFGTRSGWEGTGIKPDLDVVADKALETAHLHALRRLQESLQTASAQEKIRWGIDGLSARAKPAPVSRNVLLCYAGQYRGAVVRFDDEGLSLQFGEGSVHRLIPVSADYFVVDGRDDMRIRFHSENGTVSAFERVYQDGYRALHAKEED
jgi:hypothetical protein